LTPIHTSKHNAIRPKRLNKSEQKGKHTTIARKKRKFGTIFQVQKGIKKTVFCGNKKKEKKNQVASLNQNEKSQKSTPEEKSSIIKLGRRDELLRGKTKGK
jgi:hypothetical protein